VAENIKKATHAIKPVFTTTASPYQSLKKFPEVFIYINKKDYFRHLVKEKRKRPGDDIAIFITMPFNSSNLSGLILLTSGGIRLYFLFC